METLDRVKRTVNIMKTSALNSRLFKKLGQDMDSFKKRFYSTRKFAGCPKAMLSYVGYVFLHSENKSSFFSVSKI